MRNWHTLGLTILASLGAPALSNPPPTVTYAVTDLGTLFEEVDFSDARAVNETGQVTGYSAGINGYSRGFFWDAGVMIDLGTFTAMAGLPRDINSSGQIVGATAFPDRAWLWHDGVTTFLADGEASAINNQGQIVGAMSTGAGRRAFRWQNGVLTNLGTLGGGYSRANGINEAGQVAGTGAIANGDWHAFIWDDGVKTDLGTLGGSGSAANDINEAGHVVGRSWLTGGGWYQAYIYRDGVMANLGALANEGADALALNDLDQVVGYSTTWEGAGHAYIWENGYMTDLNDLLEDPDGWVLEAASDINNAGQIVGAARKNGVVHGVQLTPSGRPPLTCPDFNDNGVVDIADLAAFLAAFGHQVGEPAYDREMDIDLDWDVDLLDLAFLIGAYGASCP